jgi:hypothetical protein
MRPHHLQRSSALERRHSIDGADVAIVGQTDINPADFVNFRKLFNLPLGNTHTYWYAIPNIIYNGPNPGVNGGEGRRRHRH